MHTIDELIRRQAGNVATVSLRRPGLDPRRGAAGTGRAGRCPGVAPAPGPFHVALLLDNVPEYVFWMGAAALAGAVLVGGNPTHRGDELARDLAHTECQLLVTSSEYRPLVEGHDLGPALPADRILVVDDPDRRPRPGRGSGDDPLPGPAASVAGSPLPDPVRTPGHRGHPGPAPVHLGDVRRAQGVPLQPGTPGAHRRHRRTDVRTDLRRRLLPGHAPVPLQRPDGGMGAGPGRRGDRRRSASDSAPPSSSPTSGTTA